MYKNRKPKKYTHIVQKHIADQPKTKCFSFSNVAREIGEKPVTFGWSVVLLSRPRSSNLPYLFFPLITATCPLHRTRAIPIISVRKAKYHAI